MVSPTGLREVEREAPLLVVRSQTLYHQDMMFHMTSLRHACQALYVTIVIECWGYEPVRVISR